VPNVIVLRSRAAIFTTVNYNRNFLTVHAGDPGQQRSLFHRLHPGVNLTKTFFVVVQSHSDNNKLERNSIANIFSLVNKTAHFYVVQNKDIEGTSEKVNRIIVFKKLMIKMVCLLF